MKKRLGLYHHKNHKKLDFQKIILWTVIFLLAFFFFGLLLGTMVHELSHGLTAVLFGEKITDINVIGMHINSTGIDFAKPKRGYFGEVWFTDNVPDTPFSIMLITIVASFNTLIISIVFSFLLLLKKQKGIIRVLFIYFSFYFIDSLLNYIIKPFISEYGDYKDILVNTNYSLIPFSFIIFISSLTTILILIFNILSRKNKVQKNLLLYALFFVCICLISYVLYLFLT